MKKIELDKEERELLAGYERGEWKPVAGGKRALDKHRGYARRTLLKDRRVNIRISSSDLEALRVKAVEDGVPYQTLIASVLHRFVSGRLTDPRA